LPIICLTWQRTKPLWIQDTLLPNHRSIRRYHLFIPGLSTFIEIHAPGQLSLTSGFSLGAVILLAALIGATVPLILHRFGIDPALATGPFITTSNDILGVLIFFTMANALYVV